jgi:hypothetical protein
MRLHNRTVAVIGFVLALSVVAFVHQAEAQVRIEGMFPRQLPRGQETVVHVAVQSQNAIQAVEVAPSAGVKLSSIKKGESFQGAYTWSELHIAVAGDAAPGKRTLVIVLPTGRTAPVTITIPEHVPTISDLHVFRPQSNGASLEVQFAAVDPATDIGQSPYVWFMITCGEGIVPGVVHGNVMGQANGGVVVHASVPGPPLKDKCDFQVRIADSVGIESNTLKVQF